MENMTRTWLPGVRQRKSCVPLDKYKERNHGQHVLSISIGVFLLVLEVILIILAVPGKREFKVASNRAIHVEIKAPEKPLLLRYPNEPCFFSDQIIGTNLQSNSQWFICVPYLFTPFPESHLRGIGHYTVSLFHEHQLLTAFRFNNLSVEMELGYKVTVNESLETNVKFAGTEIIERFLAALETNLRMMENETNLFVLQKLISRSKQDGSVRAGSLVLDMHNTTLPSNLVRGKTFSPEVATRTILHQATAAVIVSRKPGPDTPPLQFLNVPGDGTYQDFNESLVLGFYNGPIITTLGSLILVLVSFLIYIVAISIYRSPGNLAWEVITSHGRLYGDVLLSGPNRMLEWCSAVYCDNMSNSYCDVKGYVEKGDLVSQAS